MPGRRITFKWGLGDKWKTGTEEVTMGDSPGRLCVCVCV